MGTESNLLDAVTYHRIGLERYLNSTIRKMLRHLSVVERDIVRQIMDRGEFLEGETDFQSERLKRLLKSVRDINAEGHKALREDLRKDLRATARYEAEWTRQAYQRAFNIRAVFEVPSATQLNAIVTSKPFQGGFLRDWAAKLEAGMTDRIEQQILIGMTEGEGIQQIMRRLRGTRAHNYTNGVFEISRRSAEMVARTAVNHVSNAAHMETIDTNKHLFPYYRWVSVLDGRTSPICRERSGQVYKTGEGPVPPGHPNCRSTIIGIPRGGSRDVRDDLSYAQWLEKQPARAQKEILGPTRYKLYKDGNLRMDRFIADGRVINLDQLRRLDEEAFRRAGL